jgi:hypothetical protein
LVCTKSADTPARCDAESLHDLFRANLPDTRHCLDDRRHTHLRDRFVGLATGEHIRECIRIFLESRFYVGSCPARSRCLFHRGTPLLVGERWQRHGGNLATGQVPAASGFSAARW